MIFSSLLNLPCCSCIISLISLNCLHSSLNFLETAIWNSLSGKQQMFLSLGSVTWVLLCSPGGIVFPWCFMSLTVLCLHVCSGSHLLESSWSDFGREIFVSPGRDSETFLGPQWIYLHACSLPWHSLKLLCLLWTLQSQLVCSQLPFPRAVSPRPEGTGWLCALPPGHLHKLTLDALGSVHGELATGSEGRCVGETYGLLEVSVGGLGESVGEAFSVLMGGPSTRVRDRVSQSHVPLIDPQPWLLISSPLTAPHSFSSNSVRWMRQEGSGPVQQHLLKTAPHPRAAPECQLPPGSHSSHGGTLQTCQVVLVEGGVWLRHIFVVHLAAVTPSPQLI